MNPMPAKTTQRRIVIYGMNYAPELTGVGRYSGELGDYLSDQGIKVDVISSPPHYPGWAVRGDYRNRYSVEARGNQRIFRCPLLLRTQMSGIWRLLAPVSFSLTSAPVAMWRIFTSRPDTVICVEPTLFSAPLALIAAKLVKARTLLHVQDLEVDAAFSVGHLTSGMLKALAFRLESIILRQFDIIVTISEQMRLRLGEKSARPDRVVVIRNWVDIEKIMPLPGSNTFRKQLGLDETQFVVLYAGNIGPKQALDLVVDAAQHTLADTTITYVIAGDGPEKATLVARNLANIRFLPLQPEERLCELLNLADLHILPQREGVADLVLPSKLGGMLATDKPLLVQADDGTELASFLAGVALLVPVGQSSLLADAIVREKQAQRKTLDGRGRALAKTLDKRTTLARFLETALTDPAR